MFDTKDEAVRHDVLWQLVFCVVPSPAGWTDEMIREQLQITAERIVPEGRGGKRLAPVPLFYRNNPQMGILMSGESSRTTHQMPLAIDACRYLGALIIDALHEKSKIEILSPLYCPLCWVINGA